MHVLTVCGSLRAHSSNAALLAAFRLLAPAEVDVQHYEELGDLPAFNPDWEAAPELAVVQRWRAALRRTDVIVISTPEYAHGLPGSLKNALDWVVGSGELVAKPIALLHASKRGIYAQASLREVLSTMAARLSPDWDMTVEPPRREMTAQELLAEGIAASELRSLWDRIRQATA